MTYSHMGPPTLPSAQLHFTSEFGMGSGGSTTAIVARRISYNSEFCYISFKHTLVRDISLFCQSTISKDGVNQVTVWNSYVKNHLGVVWLSLTGN